jgi:hypothetical protein
MADRRGGVSSQCTSRIAPRRRAESSRRSVHYFVDGTVVCQVQDDVDAPLRFGAGPLLRQVMLAVVGREQDVHGRQGHRSGGDQQVVEHRDVAAGPLVVLAGAPLGTDRGGALDENRRQRGAVPCVRNGAIQACQGILRGP